VVELAVDNERAGEAAVLLLKCMYSPSNAAKPLQGVSQAALVEVLRLADRLQAEVCKAAAADILAAADPLDRSTALALHDLPPSCSASAACKPLFDAAAVVLVKPFNDLDAVWLDKGKADQLLELPFALMLQLLNDRHTRACENTVFYTCCAWIAKHQADARQRRALLECVRMPHISSLYLATVVVGGISQPTDSISSEDLRFVAPFTAAPDHVKELMLTDPDAPFVSHTAWRLPKRAASVVEGCVMEERVHLQDLQNLFDEASGEPSGESVAICTSFGVWKGMEWRVMAEGEKQDYGVLMGVYVTSVAPPGVPPGAIVSVASVDIKAAQHAYLHPAVLFRTGRSWGEEDAFKLGSRALWDKAAWKKLAGAGGKVLVRVEMDDMS